MTIDTDCAWYVVYCRAQQQFRAEQNLVNQGYRCFLPVIQVEKIKKGKRITSPEALFPNYLFIYLSCTHDNWAPIRSTRGVLRLVAFGGTPIAISQSFVEQLQQRLDTAPCISALQAGDRVRVDVGAYAGIDAIFQAFDGEERVIILLNLLNQPQQVRVAAATIRKVED